MFVLTIFIILVPNSYALRIVSISPAVTEILFKLGAGSEVAGDTLFSNYPKNAETLPKVGTYIHPSMEKILELHPDYVIGMQEGSDKRIKLKFDELGIKSKFYKTESIDNIIFMIKDIAKLVQKDPNNMIKKIKLFYTQYQPAKKTGIFLVSIEPMIASTQSTFINSVMRCAGIRNIIDNENGEFIMVDTEFIIENSPNYIIVSLGIKKQIKKAEDLIKKFHLKSKLLIVNPDIYNRPSYRIVDACIDLRKRTAY